MSINGSQKRVQVLMAPVAETQNLPDATKEKSGSPREGVPLPEVSAQSLGSTSSGFEKLGGDERAKKTKIMFKEPSRSTKRMIKTNCSINFFQMKTPCRWS